MTGQVSVLASPDAVLTPGHNCWRIERANRAAVVVDAADYFRLARQAMLKARCRILLIGWDFDTRIHLDGAEKPETLGSFVLWLERHRPELEINILRWDFGALKMLARGSTWITVLRWAMHKRINFKLDSAHPVGASHHQKIVVIDDAFAVCGGIDITGARWDTREHREEDDRRQRPGGQLYGPWHDITMLVDGDAARALSELGRQRWALAGGGELAECPTGSDPWPDEIEPMFRDIEIGIARSRPHHGDCREVREIEALFIELIGSAKRFIYAENQYFASPRIADAIARRMAEADPPEIILINSVTADGWLEQAAMDGTRARLVKAIACVDHRRRFRVYHPVTAAGTPIYVHAKLMIVDDMVLRVGSSNMNNRSLGLDTECDLVLDTRLMPGRPELAEAIRRLRCDLMAEHLGLPGEEILAAGEQANSIIAMVEALRSSGRSLMPYEPSELNEVEKFIADNELLDPESPDEMFERLARRGLFRKSRFLRRHSAKR